MRGFFVFLLGNVRFFVILHNMINRRLRAEACGTVMKINLEIKVILLTFVVET